MTLKEAEIEQKLLAKLDELKYSVRPDIRDKAALEHNFREKFEALNQVSLTNAEFARLRDDIITADVYRKDLDRQTRIEFNKFQEGCVEENTNTETLVRRLLSEDYADKVIVTTIQKLGLALDETGKQAQQRKDKGLRTNRRTYKERLAPLRDKGIVIIFDECHRSQFGENHQAIKAFFPKAQLFGFTGTPIFEDNASYEKIDGNIGSYRTTEDLFEQPLHAYTITHAIDDRNVLRFHIDYFKPEGKPEGKADASAPEASPADASQPDPSAQPTPQGQPKPARVNPNAALAQPAIVDAILTKHDAATKQRRFNALLATASINDAIAYYRLFQQAQAERQAADPEFRPLHIACVFSPPAEGNKDVKQLQEDLPQEKADNQQEPEQKKKECRRARDTYMVRPALQERIYWSAGGDVAAIYPASWWDAVFGSRALMESARIPVLIILSVSACRLM